MATIFALGTRKPQKKSTVITMARCRQWLAIITLGQKHRQKNIVAHPCEAILAVVIVVALTLNLKHAPPTETSSCGRNRGTAAQHHTRRLGTIPRRRIYPCEWERTHHTVCAPPIDHRQPAVRNTVLTQVAELILIMQLTQCYHYAWS